MEVDIPQPFPPPGKSPVADATPPPADTDPAVAAGQSGAAAGVQGRSGRESIGF